MNPTRLVRRGVVAALAAATAIGLSAARAPRPWMDTRLTVDRRAQLLLREMTLEEKFWQLYMAPGDPRRDTLWTHGAFGVQLLDARAPGMDAAKSATLANAVQQWFVDSTRLGIPAIVFEEGVHGLVQRGATIFPAAVGLAASFDTALVGRVARSIADESRARGVRLLLSPVINLARDPRWGRVEETYGEDSWLSAELGAAYTAGLERRGVVAVPKHFVANFGDGGRDSYPIALDSATLADLYFPPFRAAIERGGARGIMASYNSVNGVPASQSAPLLTDVLRRQWGFKGLVISDQGGVGGANVLHHTARDYGEATAQALNAGLEVIFQSDAAGARLFWPPFKDGRIAPAVVDSAVARVLRVKFSLGLFEHPYVDPPTFNAGSLALDAATASTILLRNERATLPLSAAVRRVALIGPLSLPVGGYSVDSAVVRSLVDGWRAGAPASEVVERVPGPGTLDSSWVVVAANALSHDERGTRGAGLRAEYFDGVTFGDSATTVRVDPTVDFRWTFNRAARGVGTNWYTARWTGFVRIAPGTSRRLAVEGDDGYRLWIDDALVIDADRKVSYGQRMTDALTPGEHRLRLEYRQTTGNGRLRLLVERPEAIAAADAAIARAVTLARASDVAVVVAGVEEGEFRDRASLHLRARQEELIERLAATGRPVVVVVIAGGAVIMEPWLHRVSAVIQMAYPGEAGAEALSRVVHGLASPGGRLPFTMPRAEGQLPLTYDHLPTGRGDWYVDLTGEPQFPFGYGLSYGEFRYEGLTITGSARSERDTVQVEFRVTNRSEFHPQLESVEVAQLYVRHRVAPSAQPVLALRGAERIALTPGAGRVVRMSIPAAALRVRDAKGRLVFPPGPIEFFVGASSRDIRLRGLLEIK